MTAASSSAHSQGLRQWSRHAWRVALFFACMTASVCTAVTGMRHACIEAVHNNQLQLHRDAKYHIFPSSEEERQAFLSRTQHRFRRPRETGDVNDNDAYEGDKEDDDAVQEDCLRLDVVRVAVDNAMSDNEFLLLLGIGTPQQFLFSAIDTGSPSTFAYGPICCFHANHTFFDPTISTTFEDHPVPTLPASSGNTTDAQAAKEPNEVYTVTYGDNVSVTAVRAYDSLTFGTPGAATDITVKHQPIGLVQSISSTARTQQKGEALIGLASNLTSSDREASKLVTPFENLVRAGTLARPMLSISFVKADRHMRPLHTSATKGGRLTLGAVDEDARRGPISWTDVTLSVYWGAEVMDGGLRMGTVDLYANSSLTPRFIVDSGSSVIFAPPAIARLANMQITGAVKTSESKRWVLPCSIATDASKTQPLFNIELNGTRFAVPAEDMVLYSDTPFAKDSVTGETFCLSSIQDGIDSFTVLGNVFIKNHLIVLEYTDRSLAHRRLGVALRQDTGTIVDDQGQAKARVLPSGYLQPVQ